MKKAIRNPSETGFTIEPSRSSRYLAVIETDTDYAYDIALLSDTLEKARLLLQHVELAAQEIGLHVNEGKMKYMSYNVPQGDLSGAGRIEKLGGQNVRGPRGYAPPGKF